MTLKLSEKDYQRLLSDRGDAIEISVIPRGMSYDLLDPSEKQALKPGRSKRVEVDGFIFDSGLEAKRYSYLRMLERTGMISKLDCEHKRVGTRRPEDVTRHRWVLQDKFVRHGATIRSITYTDDFQYEMPGVGLIVEDIKGYLTEANKRAHKLLLYHFPEINFYLNYRIKGLYTESR